MSILNTLRDFWYALRADDYHKQLSDIREEQAIEGAKSQLADDKVEATLAQADLIDAKTEIVVAKIGKEAVNKERIQNRIRTLKKTGTKLLGLLVVLVLLLTLSCTTVTPKVDNSATITRVAESRTTITDKVITGTITRIVASWGDTGLYATPSHMYMTFQDGTEFVFLVRAYFEYTTRNPVVIGKVYTVTVRKWSNNPNWWHFVSAVEVNKADIGGVK